MSKTTETGPKTRQTPRNKSTAGTRASALPKNSGLVLLVAGEEHFATYELPSAGSVSIGRAEDNTICIEEPTLSRSHARLSIGDTFSVEDCGSANGTHVRNEQLEPGVASPVELNEAIVLGSVTVILQRRTPGTQRRIIRTNDYFEERLDDECARAERYGGAFSVVHVVYQGDASPAALHDALAATLRPSDIVGLYGPRQLDMLLLEAVGQDCDDIVSRIIKSLSALGVEAKSGVAAFGVDGSGPAKLLSSARSRARDIATTEAVDAGDSFVVVDPAMVKLHELVRRIAAADLTVLVLGETGVGKEIIAERLHRYSRRSEGPLVRFNCAALTQSLLESELFGHERGAFTGAIDTKKGLLEVGAGGTVFLDEVGEMPLETQVKLLRVLEERKVMRVGGTTAIPIDVRFVAATHRDLEAAVETGRFRADLFYRLNAFSIVVPPLRDRPLEIEALAQYFVSRANKRLAGSRVRLSSEARARLDRYRWPGNIRELRNAVERAVVLATGGVILPEHLPDKVRLTVPLTDSQPMAAIGGRTQRTAAVTRPPTAAGTDDAAQTTRRQPLAIKRRLTADEEKAAVIAALEETGGNQTQAAKILGVSRRTLMNKLDLHSIPRPRKKPKK